MVIKTSKFILRPFRTSDAAAIARNINDWQVARNLLTVPCPYTIRDARKYLRRTLQDQRKRKPGRINFAIDINGEVVGSIGLFAIFTHRAEIGYWLTRRFWGRGIMTLAIKKVTAFGFERLGLKRIYAHVFPFNKASMKVLKKAGFQFEGILRKRDKKGNRYLDAHLFAKIR